MRTTRILFSAVIAIYIVLRIITLFSVEMIGDEPDDLKTIGVEIEAFRSFFLTERTYGLDQARLPHYLSMPLVFLFPDDPVIPLRIMFFLFHLLYLFISYRLMKFLFSDIDTALGYVVLLSISCFLASFSVYAMTTGDSLFLMFHILSITVFVMNYRKYAETGTFENLVLWILVMGLCIASKLFGVLLMAAIFTYMLAVSGKRWKIRTFPVLYLIGADIVFLALLSVINFTAIPPVVQTYSSLGLSLLFVIFIVACLFLERRGRFQLRSTHFVVFWLTVGLTAFCLTLVFSPTHLNLRNLIRIPTWFGDWGTGKIAARSNRHDIPIIFILKYGIPSFISLLGVTTILLYRKKLRTLKDDQNGALLFFIVFIIHFTVITIVNFKVTWYPLAVFPFLYLPFIYLWRDVRGTTNRILKVAFVCLSLVLVTDNVYRYVRWFPYGHFDGAQYGKEHIGWNRAGFVSFEIIPRFVEYLDTIPAENGERISFQVVDVPRYNGWFRYLVHREYSKLPSTPFRFDSNPFKEDGSYSYVATSPVYFAEFDERMRDMSLEEVQTLRIKGIDILRVWKFEPR